MCASLLGRCIASEISPPVVLSSTSVPRLSRVARYGRTHFATTRRRLSSPGVTERVAFSLAVVATVLVLAWTLKGYRASGDDLFQRESVIFLSAGCFVAATLPISLCEISMHLTNWVSPEQQKYTVRILWMIPIFSAQSWLGLRFSAASVYLECLRDLYEAFVIQSFLYLLVEFLGGKAELVKTLRTKDKSLGRHGCLEFLGYPHWVMGRDYLLNCKRGVLQLTVIKTITTVLDTAFELFSNFSSVDGTVRPKVEFFIAVVNSVSMTFALYALAKLHKATHPELTIPINRRPLRKFLCIKLVVFATYWQGVVITLLEAKGVITEYGGWSSKEVARIITNYIVCVEMLFFAMAHTFAFSYRDFLTAADAERNGVTGASSQFDGDGNDLSLAAVPCCNLMRSKSDLQIHYELWASLTSETLSEIKAVSFCVSRSTDDENSDTGSASSSAEGIGISIADGGGVNIPV